MKCWHCKSELIWGGDHDISEEDETYAMSTNLSCPQCESIVDVYLPKEGEKNLNNLVVFNDNSKKSDGFVGGVSLINKQLEKHNLRVKLQFIEDYESSEGEYAWVVNVVPADLPISKREEVIY